MFLGWLVQPNVITGYTVCYPQKMVGHGKFSLSSVDVFTANWKLLATVLGYDKNEGKGNRFGKRALLNCVQYKTRHISSQGPLRTKVNHQCNWQVCQWNAESYERFQALTGHKCSKSLSVEQPCTCFVWKWVFRNLLRLFTWGHIERSTESTFNYRFLCY